MIRAKFYCETVTVSEDGDEYVVFQVVTSYDSPENKEWSEYTPTGTLKMTITKKGAQGRFRPGREYYVDITPA